MKVRREMINKICFLELESPNYNDDRFIYVNANLITSFRATSDGQTEINTADGKTILVNDRPYQVIEQLKREGYYNEV